MAEGDKEKPKLKKATVKDLNAGKLEKVKGGGVSAACKPTARR